MKRFMKCDACGERIIIKFTRRFIRTSEIDCTHCGTKNDRNRNKSVKRPNLRVFIKFITIIITSTVASLLAAFSKHVPIFPWYVSLALWLSVAITLLPLSFFLEALFCYEKLPKDSDE